MAIRRTMRGLALVAALLAPLGAARAETFSFVALGDTATTQASTIRSTRP